MFLVLIRIPLPQSLEHSPIAQSDQAQSTKETHVKIFYDEYFLEVHYRSLIIQIHIFLLGQFCKLQFSTISDGPEQFLPP